MENKIEELRKEKGWSQEELSIRSKVSRNTISALETGSHINVTYSTMKKIAKALNKTVEYIFFDLTAQQDVQKTIATPHIKERK